MTTQTNVLPPKPASAAGPALRPGVAPLAGFALALQRTLEGRCRLPT
ncbi:hypothetical protein [Collimonas fungivorans]|nr:hypothetical protein [Collimonas fungivorans]